MLDLNEVYLAGARLAVGGGRGGGRVTKCLTEVECASGKTG